MNVKLSRVTVSAAISWLMKIVLVGVFPYELYVGEYLFAFATLIAIILSVTPSIVARSNKVTLPFELDLLITLAIFLHLFLGEVLRLYETIEAWDKILHLFSTAVISMLAFMTVYTLHYTKKLRLTVPLVGFITLSFAMFMGSMWEIMEFAIDHLFDKQTQPGLHDTMWDLIYDFIGGGVIAILGMVYVKYTNPEARKRMTRPLGEIFGIKEKRKRS